MVIGTFSAASGLSTGYTELPPLTAFAGDVYYIKEQTIYRVPEVGGEPERLTPLSDEAFRVAVREPQLYSYDNILWTVIENVDSGAVLLRGFKAPYDMAFVDIVLKGWPEQGRFVNGQFYYSAADLTNASQVALYAVDVSSGVSIQIESRSVLTFAAADRYLYFAPYELLAGQNGSVAFASEPPYEVYRFDTTNGDLIPLGFGVPYPDVYVIGEKIFAISPDDENPTSFQCLTFDPTSGASEIAFTIESEAYPQVIVSDDYLVLQTSGKETTYHVYDKQLQAVQSVSQPRAQGVLPVALTKDRLYTAKRTTDGATGFVTYDDFDSVSYLSGDH